MEKTLSKYAVRLDKNSFICSDNVDFNKMTLKYYERHFNDVLRIRGYVFLRDIYEAFGIPITQESCVVGWYYRKDNPVGDNFVEFNIVEKSDGFVVDFNVDGSILENF